MPGVESLKQQQYYAHPRNAFWPIVDELLGISSKYYTQRMELLNDRGVGLWDVLAQCERKGSLDSDIRADSIEINDFSRLFVEYKNIKTVLLNGVKAFELFEKHVVKAGGLPNGVDYYKMPSTSPAYAAMPFKDKLVCWAKHLG